jgi:predicted dehydrogenase
MMKAILCNAVFCFAALALAACGKKDAPAPAENPPPAPPAEESAAVRLITLDPGHFHAALVQKDMYPQVDPRVRVYAPAGPDLDMHLGRINSFNNRAENPTRWDSVVYRGEDFLSRMISERAGNVVVISGNNAKKTDYLFKSVDAGFHVLADKPMAIDPAGFVLLRNAFDRAREKGVLLYDIMTERYEITSMLQKELSHNEALFGTLDKGSPEDPAVTKISVHHFFKHVAGSPLRRPPWFFDVTQQGEGIVDVTTHLVDLIQWACFPEQILDGPRDVRVLSARRWATPMTKAEFQRVTSLEDMPDYLQSDLDEDGVLQVFANGEFVYTLRDVHMKVSVTWDYEAPPGGGDTHFSLMRGSRASLIIRQGPEQKFRPTLYVVNRSDATAEEFQQTLESAVKKLSDIWPGIEIQPAGEEWVLIVPDRFHAGHEAHFGQVARKYLSFLEAGAMPDWEVPNMIAKYYTIMKAYEMSR